MADTFDLTIRAITPYVGTNDAVYYSYDVDILHKVDGVAAAKYPRRINMPATVTTPAAARVYGQAAVDDIKDALAFTRDPKKPGDSAPQLAVGNTFTLS